MPSQLTNYQCPACTGPLHFDGASGRLVCDYCGSAYEVAEIEAMFGAKEQQAAAAGAAAEQKAARNAAAAAEMGLDADEWGPGEGLKAYNCPSCGAELICDATTAATSCPYCGNPTVIAGQFAGGKKPDLVIPFKYEKDAAVEALKKHYKGKLLLPKAFTAGNHIEEVKGVYVPFWLFDGEADGQAVFEATKSRTFETPNERIKRIDHYDCDRAGTVGFTRVPADASTKMPDEHMDAIEPFDYSELRPFSTAYLPGYLADKYDVSADESFQRIEPRAAESAVQALQATVKGYESVKAKTKQTQVRQTAASYALLPVWLLSTKYEDRNYLFAMNGQTGRLIGDLPKSKARMAALFAALFVPLALILWLVSSSVPLAVIVPLIIAGIVLLVENGKMKTAVRQTNANNYISESGLRLARQSDRFTHTTEERTPKAQNTQQSGQPPKGQPPRK